MGLFRPSREQRGPDPYLLWKVALFTVGGAVALFGIFTGRDAAVLAAIVVLALGLVLRVVSSRRS